MPARVAYSHCAVFHDKEDSFEADLNTSDTKVPSPMLSGWLLDAQVRYTVPRAAFTRMVPLANSSLAFS